MGQFSNVLKTLPNKAAPVKNILGQAFDYMKGHAAHGVTPGMAAVAGAGHAVYHGVTSGHDPMEILWDAIKEGAITGGSAAAIGSMAHIPPAAAKYVAPAALTKMVLPPPEQRRASGGLARAIRIARKYQDGGDIDPGPDAPGPTPSVSRSPDEPLANTQADYDTTSKYGVAAGRLLGKVGGLPGDA